MLPATENLELTKLKHTFDYNLFFDEDERITAQKRINELLDKDQADETTPQV